MKEAVLRLQSDFDRMIGAWISGYRLMGGKVFCSDRCSNCCSLTVNCSWAESLSISDHVSESHSQRLREHAGKLKSVLERSADFRSFLKMHRQEIGHCPFLSNGSCSIYEMRPFSCRSLLATKESRWCGADFGEMSRDDKQAFVESLDREVVAFPMHYVAATQEMGQQLEMETAALMDSRYGFSVYGNLPLMVFLNREYEFAAILQQGYVKTVDFLEKTGLNHPFLVSLSVPPIQ